MEWKNLTYSIQHDVFIKQCGFSEFYFQPQACFERSVLALLLLILLLVFGFAVLWSTLSVVRKHPPIDTARFAAILSLVALILIHAVLLSLRLLFFETATLDYVTVALRTAVTLMYVEMRLVEYYCATRHLVPGPGRLLCLLPGVVLLVVLCAVALSRPQPVRTRCSSTFQATFLLVEWLAILILSVVSYKHLRRLARINTEASVRAQLRRSVIASLAAFAVAGLSQLMFFVFVRLSPADSCSGAFGHSLRYYLPAHALLVVTTNLLPCLALLLLFHQDVTAYKKMNEQEHSRLLDSSVTASISPTRSLYRPVYPVPIDFSQSDGTQVSAYSVLDPIQELEESQRDSWGSVPSSRLSSPALLIN